MGDIMGAVVECLDRLRALEPGDRRLAVSAIVAVLDLASEPRPMSPAEMAFAFDRDAKPVNPTPKVPRKEEKPARRAPKGGGGSRKPETVARINAITRLLREWTGPMSPTAIASALGEDKRSILDALTHMRRDGTVIGTGATSKRFYHLATTP